MVEVKVAGLAIDERSKTPVVILQETQGTRVLPIWIGPTEAGAIAMELAGKKFQRPLTHDLMKTIVVEALKVRVARVVITELRENTFYAKIFLARDKEIIAIDARPSDSIALAIRAHSPIFVAPELLSDDRTPEPVSDEEKARALQKHLRDMNPEDFGKFSL
jgi:bifunctional DNase/RNase